MAPKQPLNLEQRLTEVLGDASRANAIITSLREYYFEDEIQVGRRILSSIAKTIQRQKPLQRLLTTIPKTTAPGTLGAIIYTFDHLHGHLYEAASRAHSDKARANVRGGAAAVRTLYAALTDAMVNAPELADSLGGVLDAYNLSALEAEPLSPLPKLTNLLTTATRSTLAPDHRAALMAQLKAAAAALKTQRYVENFGLLCRLATTTAIRGEASVVPFTTHAMASCAPKEPFDNLGPQYSTFALRTARWIAEALPFDSEAALESARTLYDQLCMAYAQSISLDTRESQPFENALTTSLFTADAHQSPLLREPVLIDALAGLLRAQNQQRMPMFSRSGKRLRPTDHGDLGSFPNYDYFFEAFAKWYAPLAPPVRAQIQELFSSYRPGELSAHFATVCAAIGDLPEPAQEPVAAYLVALDAQVDRRSRRDVRDVDHVLHFGELYELLTPSFISAAPALRLEPSHDVLMLLQQMQIITGLSTLHTFTDESRDDWLAQESERRRTMFYHQLAHDARPLAVKYKYLLADWVLPKCQTEKFPRYLAALLALPPELPLEPLPPYDPKTTLDTPAQTPESIDHRIALLERIPMLSPIAAVIPALCEPLAALPKKEQLPTAITLFDQAQVVYAKLVAKGISAEVIAGEVEQLAGALSTAQGRSELARGIVSERILAPYREGRCTLLERATPLGICATALAGTNVDITSIDPLDLPAFRQSALVRAVQAQAHTISLPSEVDVFPIWKQNAELLSALSAIGTGMIKYDSLHVDPARLRGLAERTPYAKHTPAAKTDLSAYLDAFPQPELAKLLFGALEYIRVGTLMGNHYVGAQRQLAQVHRAVEELRRTATLPYPDALVEQLTTAAFAQSDAPEIAPLLAQLSPLRSGTPTVEDSLELLAPAYCWTEKYLTAHGYMEPAKPIAVPKRFIVPKGSIQFMLPQIQIVTPTAGAADYLEFDFERGAFSRRVKVHERPARATPNTVAADIRTQDATTIATLRQAYRTLHPTGIRIERRLSDGELDTDAYLEYRNDRAAGLPGDERFFSRKQILDRKRATLIAADLGASVNKFVGEQRIADAIQRTVVYIAETLQDDPNEFFGIYGYNSNGPEQVVAHVVKDPAALFTEEVRQRIGNMVGNYGNRDGAILRHLSQKLRMLPADRKRLIVLTDGLPDDVGYKDRYAVEDTKRARVEAQELGIRPFAFVLNPQPVGVLEEIWGPNNFFQLSDLTKIPMQAAELYLRIFAK